MAERFSYATVVDRAMHIPVSRRVFNRTARRVAAAFVAGSTGLLPTTPAFGEVLVKLNLLATEEERIINRYPFILGRHDGGDDRDSLQKSIANEDPVIEGNGQISASGIGYLAHDPRNDLRGVISIPEFCRAVTDGGSIVHLDLKKSAAGRPNMVRSQTKAFAQKRRMWLSSEFWPGLDYFIGDEDYLRAYTVKPEKLDDFNEKLASGVVDGQAASVDKDILLDPSSPYGVNLDFLSKCYQHKVVILGWVINNIEAAKLLMPYFQDEIIDDGRRFGGFNTDHPERFESYRKTPRTTT